MTVSVSRPGRTVVTALGGVAAALALVVWCAHPVCVPLSDEAVVAAARNAPLETRTDRQWHGRVFQRRDGRWHQCKSWISRKLFF